MKKRNFFYLTGTIFLLICLAGCTTTLKKNTGKDDKQIVETLLSDQEGDVTNKTEEYNDQELNSSSLNTIGREVLGTAIEAESFMVAAESQYSENENGIDMTHYVLEDFYGEAASIGETKILSGYVYYPDGYPKAVTASTKVNQVFRGDEAYKMLLDSNSDLQSLENGMEYIVINLTISYQDGDSEYISLRENDGTRADMDFFFSMVNDSGVRNRQQMLDLLDDDIYSLPDLIRGESVTGTVVFLQECKSSTLFSFIAFGEGVLFSVNE